MLRTLPALRPLTWDIAGLNRAALLVVGVLLAIVNVTFLSGMPIFHGRPIDLVLTDYGTLVEAGQRAWNGEPLYEIGGTYWYRWSPVAAYGLPLLSMIGVAAWRLLHIAAALAMPSRLLTVAVLASWPFWNDLETGNVLTFQLLAAAWALRGSRGAGLAFLAMAILMPRPLVVPVAAWLLWQRPDLRWPAGAMFALHALGVLATGQAVEWVGLLASSGTEMTSPHNLSPSRLIGPWWMVLGLPLAAWLTWRGRLGLASLAAAPYWFGYYILFALLELIPSVAENRQQHLHLNPGAPP